MRANDFAWRCYIAEEDYGTIRRRDRGRLALKLNLGCGRDIKPGFVNIDHFEGPGVDKLWDLDVTPLPFEDNSVDYVFCSHVLEHLKDWEKLVMDVHRILKPGGEFEIRVPYGFQPRAYHRHYFGRQSLELFLVNRSGDEISSNDPRVEFEMIKQGYGRRTPLRWHLKKYAGIELSYASPIGRRFEIFWILRKPVAAGQADSSTK